MPSMRLTTVHNNSHQFIVLWNCDFLPGWPSGGPIAPPLACVSTAVLTSHSRYSVGLHIQHPGELYQKQPRLKTNLYDPGIFSVLHRLQVHNLGLQKKKKSSYPNLLIIFYGASTFPIKAKAHEVNTEDTGQGFDTCPLHCSPLWKMNKSTHTLKAHVRVIEN